METETLRPELQNLVPHGEPQRRESADTPVSQLKQEPTVNHQLQQSKQDVAPITPKPKTNNAAQVPSPRSDDPATEMEDVLDSLQDPKPSSASTDPAPQLQNPQPKGKQSLLSPVRPPSGQPQLAIEKAPGFAANKLPARSTTARPLRPFPFPHEDGFSSDEDEDFCRFYRAMLRRKSDSEMATPTPPSPVVVEHPKKPRNTRQSNSKVQKRKAKGAVREIPFSDPKYHKVVGPMVLPPSKIARDLATIYGREYKGSPVENPKTPVRQNERKRQRGSETPTGNGTPNAKRLRQTSAQNAEPSDKNTSAEIGRSTRYAKRSIAQSASPGERGYQGSNKRQKTGGSSAGGAEIEQKKMFEKHPDRKGWVVCKKCDAAVWPPNCGKHLFHCRNV